MERRASAGGGGGAAVRRCGGAAERRRGVNVVRSRPPSTTATFARLIPLQFRSMRCCTGPAHDYSEIVDILAVVGTGVARSVTRTIDSAWRALRHTQNRPRARGKRVPPLR
ncbi:unnamed protein product, partial [Iphiclides podalirius]